MMFELMEQLTTLALLAAGLYLVLGAYRRHAQPAWSTAGGKRRFGIELAIVLLVTAIKVGEEVIDGESGPLDTSILLFIHSHVPAGLNGTFRMLTLSGSSYALYPLTILSTLALLLMRRRQEALLLATSVITGALVVYLIKLAVGRVRPTLWQTEEYWGSSFPSGHTLVTAAFATATVLCLQRIRPGTQTLTLTMACSWTAAVALSRLVLGVHWPTDVVAAACIGAFIPLAMRVMLESVLTIK